MKINSSLIPKTDNYTTDEEVIGTWLDKPLYRKVIQYNFSTTTTSGYFEYSISVANLNIKTMVDIYGSIGYRIGASNERQFALQNPHQENIIYGIHAYFKERNKIMIEIGRAYSNLSWTAYLVLEYTKTTD